MPPELDQHLRSCLYNDLFTSGFNMSAALHGTVLCSADNSTPLTTMQLSSHLCDHIKRQRAFTTLTDNSTQVTMSSELRAAQASLSALASADARHVRSLICGALYARTYVAHGDALSKALKWTERSHVSCSQLQILEQILAVFPRDSPGEKGNSTTLLDMNLHSVRAGAQAALAA